MRPEVVAVDDWLILLILAVPLIVLGVWAFLDALRRPDLPVARRVLWAAALVLIPIIGLAVYLVVRPPRERRISRISGGDESGATAAAALVDAAEANRRGELSDDDYRATVAELTRSA